jgi:hypothetical protein
MQADCSSRPGDASESGVNAASGPMAAPTNSRLPVRRINDRDRRIVEGVSVMRLLTRDQVYVRDFETRVDSSCQRSLTRLVRDRWLDTLPGRRPWEPAIYLLTRHSVRGNEYIRTLHGEAEFRRRMYRLGSVPHLLGVNDIRVRAERGAQDLNWRLLQWRRPDELEALMPRGLKLVPDAFFQIERSINGVRRHSGFFVEFERSLKSKRVVKEKLDRFADLFYSGEYRARFGISALRILVVYADERGVLGEQRAERALELAEEHGFTLPRFAALNQLRQAAPIDLFTAPLWWQPRQAEPVRLFAP